MRNLVVGISGSAPAGLAVWDADGKRFVEISGGSRLAAEARLVELLAADVVVTIYGEPAGTPPNSRAFRAATGWQGRTSECGRRAAMLVLGLEARV